MPDEKLIFASMFVLVAGLIALLVHRLRGHPRWRCSPARGWSRDTNMKVVAIGLLFVGGATVIDAIDQFRLRALVWDFRSGLITAGLLTILGVGILRRSSFTWIFGFAVLGWSIVDLILGMVVPHPALDGGPSLLLPEPMMELIHIAVCSYLVRIWFRQRDFFSARLQSAQPDISPVSGKSV